MNQSPTYTGLPALPQPERADPMTDANGMTVGQNEQKKLDQELKRQDEQRKREEERKRNKYDNRGNRRPGCGCRAIGCGAAFILFAIFAFIIYIIVARPPSIVNPIKSWLNEDLQAVEYDLTAQEPIDRFNKQLVAFGPGENDVVLDEEQLNILINRKLAVGDTTANVNIVGNQLKVFIDGTPEAEVPLWVVVNFAVDQKDTSKLIIDGVGTERLSTPDFLNQIILDSLLSANSAVNLDSQNKADDFLDLIIRLDSAATITDLKIENGKMTIKILFNTGLENLFQ